MTPHIELGTRLGPRPYDRSNLPDSRPIKRVYDFIVDYKRSHDGNSPTFREIMQDCNITSTSMVLYYLKKLEKKGLVRRPEPPIGSRYAVKIEIVGGEWSFNG